MNALDNPTAESLGFLWFLRVVAVLAIPLYALAAGISAGFEFGVLGLLLACALAGVWIAQRVDQGGFQFALVGVVTGIECGIVLVAITR